MAAQASWHILIRVLRGFGAFRPGALPGRFRLRPPVRHLVAADGPVVPALLAPHLLL